MKNLFKLIIIVLTILLFVYYPLYVSIHVFILCIIVKNIIIGELVKIKIKRKFGKEASDEFLSLRKNMWNKLRSGKNPKEEVDIIISWLKEKNLR